MPCIPGVRIVSFVAMLLAFSGQIPAEQRATLGDGKVVTGRVRGETLEKLQFLTDRSTFVPLRSVREVRLSAPPRFPDTSGPPRTIVLRGGDRLTADVVRANDMRAEWVAWEKRHPLPLSQISGIVQPPDAFTLFYEDFENRAAGKESVKEGGKAEIAGAALDDAHHASGKHSLRISFLEEPISWTLPAPLSEGLVDLSFYEPQPNETVPGSTLLVTFDLILESAGAEHVLRTTLRSVDDFYHVTASASASPHKSSTPSARLIQLAEQRLRRRPGWRRLRILLEPQQLLMFLDEQSLATGTLAECHLRELRVSTARIPLPAAAPQAADKADAPLWIDDLRVQQPVPSLPTPLLSRKQDLLWLREGEELFGEMISLDRRELEFKGVFGTRTVPWSDVRGVWFRERTPPAREIRGLFSRIEFAHRLGAPPDATDALRAALSSVTAETIRLDHPQLGRLEIPLREVDRIVPEFQGRSWMVEPATQHLGDSIREDFSVKLPGGTVLQRTWKLPAIPKGTWYVSLLAGDLEPGGPRAPTDAPFRQELTRGHLTTELLINGQRVFDLNRFVNLRALPRNPQPVRVPIPAKMLKAGDNTLRLQLRPASGDATEFDDFELSRLTVECVE